MFRFTIRDLLWLMVVVALAVAWWADNLAARKQLIHCYSELRGLEVDKELMERFLLDFPNDSSKIEYAKETASAWRYSRTGDKRWAPPSKQDVP
ncbi:MAG TPA: hypothetical protein VGI40_00630 [Pirellulaceae bacterium]|jgi:hypothetical protein